MRRLSEQRGGTRGAAENTRQNSTPVFQAVTRGVCRRRLSEGAEVDMRPQQCLL